MGQTLKTPMKSTFVKWDKLLKYAKNVREIILQSPKIPIVIERVFYPHPLLPSVTARRRYGLRPAPSPTFYLPTSKNAARRPKSIIAAISDRESSSGSIKPFMIHINTRIPPF
jgi:hypothetical protein